MAIENLVWLNGYVKKVDEIRMGNEVLQMDIDMGVIRSRNYQKTPEKNKTDKEDKENTERPREDVVVIRIKNERDIKYLKKENISKFNVLRIKGIFMTKHIKRTFICKNCGTENTEDGSACFIYPLWVNLCKINPRHVEYISISEYERGLNKEEIFDILNERKIHKGEILSREDLGQNNKGDFVIKIIVEETLTEDYVSDWLLENSETSNIALLIGNLCDTPIYNPKEQGGRICSYQLGINRKICLKNEDPDIRADYPWVKSLGDQADQDKSKLQKGSLVLVNGSIQARSKYKIKKYCQKCNELHESEAQTMEIVPYEVEYLRNCLNPENSVDVNQESETIPVEKNVNHINSVWLNGFIKECRRIRDKGNNDKIIEIKIVLVVIRRPSAAYGNISSQLKKEEITVIINNSEQITLFESHKVATGDIMQLKGILTRKITNLYIVCNLCKEKTYFEHDEAYVSPTWFTIHELAPKHMEVLSLTEEESVMEDEPLFKLIHDRKIGGKEILSINKIGRNRSWRSENGEVLVEVIAKNQDCNDLIMEWLRFNMEASSHIYITGYVLEDPVLSYEKKGTKSCIYNVKTRKGIYKIHSYDEQADSDYNSLIEGSYVFINGSLQVYLNEKREIVCDDCKQIYYVRTKAMEIVPYSVEYLNNCVTGDYFEEEDF